MLSEIWILIKLLFKTRPSEAKAKGILDIKVMKHFPFKGYGFMMWCGYIVARNEKEDVIKRFLSTKAGKIKETHEFGHCVQAEAEHGDNWLRYYINYFWYWLKHGFGNPLSANYYINRYECEAYAHEEHPNYWKCYSQDNLKGKYSIAKAKKIFKDLGGKEAWKEYVKGL